MEFRFLLGLVHADVISKTKKKLAQSTARNKEHLIHNHNNNICIFGCWSFFVVLFLVISFHIKCRNANKVIHVGYVLNLHRPRESNIV
jgi:heme/copper-type cytochrome/quinol oxidase subunit 2